MQPHHNEGSLLFQMPHPSTHHCCLAYQSGRLVYTIIKTGKGYVIYVTESIQHGFHMDINYSSPLQVAQYNTALALACPEIASGRNFGCFPKESIPDLQINLMGELLKGQGTLNYRFIFPEGASMNDRIDPQRCSLQYMHLNGLSRLCSPKPQKGDMS